MNRVQADIGRAFHRRRLCACVVGRHPFPPRAAGLVGRRLGSAAHTDGGRASVAARHHRQQPGSSDGRHGARVPVHPIHAAVQHERPARDQRAGRVDRRRAAGRRPAGGRPMGAKTFCSGWPANWKSPSRGRTARPRCEAARLRACAERLDDVACAGPAAGAGPVGRSRPEVGAVRVLQRDRGLADRRGHLVDLGIAQRRHVVEQAGEVVLQTARIPARKCPRDNGADEFRMPQSRRGVRRWCRLRRPAAARCRPGRPPLPCSVRRRRPRGCPVRRRRSAGRYGRCGCGRADRCNDSLPGSMSGAKVPRCPPAFGPWTTRPSAPAARATPAS